MTAVEIEISKILMSRTKKLNTDGCGFISDLKFFKLSESSDQINLIIFNNSISSVARALWIHVFQIPVGIRFLHNFQQKYKFYKKTTKKTTKSCSDNQYCLPKLQNQGVALYMYDGRSYHFNCVEKRTCRKGFLRMVFFPFESFCYKKCLTIIILTPPGSSLQYRGQRLDILANGMIFSFFPQIRISSACSECIKITLKTSIKICNKFLFYQKYKNLFASFEIIFVLLAVMLFSWWDVFFILFHFWHLILKNRHVSRLFLTHTLKMRRK